MTTMTLMGGPLEATTTGRAALWDVGEHHERGAICGRPQDDAEDEHGALLANGPYGAVSPTMVSLVDPQLRIARPASTSPTLLLAAPSMRLRPVLDERRPLSSRVGRRVTGKGECGWSMSNRWASR